MTEQGPLLEVEDLRVRFEGNGGVVEAVKGVSFEVSGGKVLAIVGESGSGKSVTALSLTGLLPGDGGCRVGGAIWYCGQDLLRVKEEELRRVRGKEIAYVFQDPSASLNPVFTVGEQIAEGIRLHFPKRKNVKRRVVELLEQVGIREAEARYYAYPHELSGGMQQRVMIAMALACEPRILVADEPTTALDVTIQKQIMELLKGLKTGLGMSVILITHNFSLLRGFADEVVVMWRGKVVERGVVEEVLENPKHGYTRALIHCIPRLDRKLRRLPTIEDVLVEEA